VTKNQALQTHHESSNHLRSPLGVWLFWVCGLRRSLTPPNSNVPVQNERARLPSPRLLEVSSPPPNTKKKQKKKKWVRTYTAKRRTSPLPPLAFVRAFVSEGDPNLYAQLDSEKHLRAEARRREISKSVAERIWKYLCEELPNNDPGRKEAQARGNNLMTSLHKKLASRPMTCDLCR